MAGLAISLKDELSLLPTLLGESNYPMWTKRMRTFLKNKELWAVVNQDPGPAPHNRVLKQLSDSGHVITMKIGDRVYNGLVTEANESNGYLLWKKITNTYARYTTHRFTKCMSNWHSVRYDGKMLDFIKNIEDCLDAFAAIAHPLSSKDICSVIVSKISLTRRALTDTFILNAEMMENHDMLIERLKDIAEEEEDSRKKPNQEKAASAYNNSARTRPPPGCRNGIHNPDATHPEERCWSAHPETRKIRNPRMKASQHHTTAPQSDAAPSVNSTPTASNTPAPSQYQTPAFSHITTTEAIAMTTNIEALPVVLDSGASHHMFNDEKFFDDTRPCNIVIRTGDGSANLMATLEGTASVMDSAGKILRLPGSLYVPGLTRNLLSLGKLSTKSFSMTRTEDTCLVSVDNSANFACILNNGILELKDCIGPIPSSPVTFATVTHSGDTSPYVTWHARLGHSGIARLKCALSDNKLIATPNCDVCMKGKVARSSFKGHFDKTSHPLEVVHGDLVGPINPTTNAGSKYFLTLVDQHTGFISTTLLKLKSDATAAIIDFRTFFENQTGQSIKKLITDGGGEFCNGLLSDHLKTAGIQHNVSPPYTPQHNGIAERANKTIINMARCMMVQSRLSKEWWGEAVLTAMATTNCLPSLSKSKLSPVELLFGKSPNMAFFRPFGCKAWVIKPNQTRTGKFDSISWDGIMIGYSNDYSAYRIVRVDDKKVFETRHAYFDESTFPGLSAIHSSNDLYPLDPLPNFAAAPIFPFDSEEDTSSINEDAHHEEPEMDVDVDMNEHDTGDEPDTPPGSDVEMDNDDPPQPTRRLILRLGPHPTRITSDIDTSNIISGSRRSAVTYSVTTVEPKNHFQAIRSDESSQWILAEDREIENMRSHGVWQELPRLPSHSCIPSTWAYKKKLGADNQVVEYKARICAQGFRQTYGLNFDMKYAPTGKPSSLRVLLSHAVTHGFKVHQLDVKSAFLTCDLDETVYMLPPPGYKPGEDLVLLLKKAIYGLKQASLAWYKRLSSFLASIGFVTSLADPCVFWRTNPSPLWIFAHVDDLIIVGTNPEEFRDQISKEFAIKYMGDASFLLGMKLERLSTGIILNQTQYIERKLVEFEVVNLPVASCPLDPRSHLSKATSLDIQQLQPLNINYRAIIGSLNYLSILTRPDISFAVSKLSQFLENPGLSHYKAAMQVLRYLKGTINRGLLFGFNKPSTIYASVDADWANCPDTRRSHTGFMVTWNEHLISWKSTKQSTVSLSSTEAEYKALADVAKEVTWLSNLLKEIELVADNSIITISVDNQGAIDLALSQTSQNGFRTKHMDLRLHFVRDLIHDKVICLRFVSSSQNTSDYLTKPVGRIKIKRALCSITEDTPSISASSPKARSTSTCQNPALDKATTTSDCFLNRVFNCKPLKSV
jgi:transposase InsO family protein